MHLEKLLHVLRILAIISGSQSSFSSNKPRVVVPHFGRDIAHNPNLETILAYRSAAAFTRLLGQEA